MKKEKFEIGNLVSVAGGSIGKDGAFSNDADVCIVSAVGLHDLIVESTSLQSSYKVPKCLCNVIKVEPKMLGTAHVSEPEIGDLVTSFERKYYSKEEPKSHTGVLYKIDYKLGRPDKCTLLCGSDFVDVRYDTIILVQRR